MENKFLKKSLIISIILLTSSTLSPLLTADTSYDEDILVSFTLYGKQDVIKCEALLSYEDAIFINDFFKELRYNITYHPFSDETQCLKSSFVKLLDEKGLLPNDISNDDIIESLNPPNFYQILQNRLFKCFLPVPKVSSAKGTAFFCSVASGGSGKTTPFVILPRPHIFVFWHGGTQGELSVTHVGTIRSEKGFIASGNQDGMLIGFVGLGLTYGTPFGAFYGLIGYTVYASVTADYIEFYPPNSKPEISNPNPSNNQENIPTSLNELSFQIHDDDNEMMDYSVTTDPYIGSDSKNSVGNDIYTIPISGLQHSTTYSWTVTVTDGKDTTEKTYRFSTIQEAPRIVYTSPADGEVVGTEISELSFTLNDPQGDLMDYTVETSPDIGEKSESNIPGGTYHVPVSGIVKDTWYYWYVNATDGTHWSYNKFSFYTGDYNLIAYWSFDEGAGNIAHDSSGNNFDGTVSGADWVSGHSGTGLEFKDNSDIVKGISSSLDNKFSDYFSVECWIYWYGSTGPVVHIIFDSRIGTSNSGKGFYFFINGTGHLKFETYTTSGHYEASSQNMIPANKWTHIKGSYNYNSKKLSVYINNVLDGELSYSLPYLDSSDSKSIGNNHWAPGDGQWRPFNGIIDELRIYNNVLT